MAIFFAGFSLALAEKKDETGFERPQVIYKAEGQRDPFQGPKIEQKITEATKIAIPLPDLKVQGVLWGSKMPQAIINNKVVKIGDIIGTAQVSNIDKEGVSIIYEGKNYHLSAPAAVKPASNKTQGGEHEKNF